MTRSASSQQFQDDPKRQRTQKPQNAQMPQNTRIASIELFRILAMVAIIAIHTSPFGFSLSPDEDRFLPILIDLSCRFAVPFFFIASGYFLGEKVRAGKDVVDTFWRAAKRLLSLYVVWSLFYFLLPLKYLYDLRLNTWFPLVLKNLKSYGLSVLMTGSNYVLWFLPALVLALGIVAICIAKGWQKQLPYVAIALYGVGLWWGSYSLLWSGSDAMNRFIIDTRNGPFFSTLYVTLGWLISNRKGRLVNAQGAIAIALGGLLLQILEAKQLSAAATVPFRGFDYLIGTTAFGTGIFLLALAKPNWGRQWPILGWSRYTLGIFLIHPIFRALLKPLDTRFNHTLWEITLPFTVYLLSLAVVFLMGRHRSLKQWVM